MWPLLVYCWEHFCEHRQILILHSDTAKAQQLNCSYISLSIYFLLLPLKAVKIVISPATLTVLIHKCWDEQWFSACCSRVCKIRKVSNKPCVVLIEDFIEQLPIFMCINWFFVNENMLQVKAKLTALCVRNNRLDYAGKQNIIIWIHAHVCQNWKIYPSNAITGNSVILLLSLDTVTNLHLIFFKQEITQTPQLVRIFCSNENETWMTEIFQVPKQWMLLWRFQKIH